MSVVGSPVTAPSTVLRSQHDAAVADLVRRYRELPPGARVRLGKKTSNLFRFGSGGGDTERLDTSSFTGVIDVDPVARTAQVQGMTTYEHLVEVTLAYGLMPLVVPQLKTITLGGAVTGLGIESTSFRHGLPHESVREMDVLVPGGEVLTVRPDNEHADLFRGFANSYATLGYALRLEIDLQPVAPYVRLEHRRVPTGELAEAIRAACAGGGDSLPPGGGDSLPPGGGDSLPPGGGDSLPPGGADFVDGVVFTRDEQYLTVASFTDDPGAGPSDYTGQQVFYKSIRERRTDVLTTHDYLWRWDTDWFWCSAALGAQHPLVRRVWPGRYRRSDVYRRIVALDRRTRFSGRVRALLRVPQEEPVIQDVEIPVDRLPEFLDAFHRDIGIEPVWLCPLQLRRREDGTSTTWPLYPMKPYELYVNVGFWSTVPEVPGDPEGHNRRIEELVASLGGHKSLYSTVHYAEAEFWAHYNGPAYRELKERYDPDGRLPDLYSKVTGRA